MLRHNQDKKKQKHDMLFFFRRISSPNFLDTTGYYPKEPKKNQVTYILH